MLDLTLISVYAGECNLQKLSGAEDGIFTATMEKIGMKKKVHMCHFRTTLLEWFKDPGTTV